jgi:hypothetical protein
MNQILVIIKQCQDVISGEVSREDFAEFLSTIAIRHTLGLHEMFLLTYSINIFVLAANSEDKEYDHYALDVEIRSELEYLALKLGETFDESMFEIGTYDMFEQSGLLEFVAGENPRQYQKYKELVATAVNLNAVAMIGQLADKLGISTVKLVDMGNNPEFLEAIKRIEK